MIAVIGDVHGCGKTLERLTEKIIDKYDIKEFVFVGDLIDRGKNIKETLDFVLSLKSNYKLTFLLGNHEEMFLDFIKYLNLNDWLKNSGKQTIESFFGIDSYNLIDRELRKLCEEYIYSAYKDIFDYLKLYYIVNDKYLISHAGYLNENKPLYEYDRFSFIWERGIDYIKNPYFDYILVHGHTPVKNITLTCPDDVLFNKNDNCIVSINVDTGCVYGYSLSALVIDNDNNYYVVSEKCID